MSKDVYGHEWSGFVCKVCGTTSDRAAAVRRCEGPQTATTFAPPFDPPFAPAFTTFDAPSIDSTSSVDSGGSLDSGGSFDSGFSGGESGGGGGGSDF